MTIANSFTFRTFEATTLRPLLQWGETSLETSVNQPSLPHAVIVLNSTITTLSTVEEWGPRNRNSELAASQQGHFTQHQRPSVFFKSCKMLETEWSKD